MGRKGNPALVGAFVVGAVLLAIVGIVVLGSGTLFRSTYPFVTYFTGSVNGLSVGALVKFRGVQIGHVTGVSVLLTNEGEPGSGTQPRVGVRYELDGDRITQLSGPVKVDFANRADVDRMVDAGLRAQLQSESILTGVLYVDLDFLKDTPQTLVLGDASPVPEIPSVPTALEQAQLLLQEGMQALKGVDIRAIALAVKDAATGLATIVNSPEIPRMMSGLQETLVDLQQLVRRVDAQVEPLAKRLGNTAGDASRTLAHLDETLDSVRGTLDTVRDTLGPEAPMPVELSRALIQLGEAARAVRQLADVLERHPNAVIFGRPNS